MVHEKVFLDDMETAYKAYKRTFYISVYFFIIFDYPFVEEGEKMATLKTDYWKKLSETEFIFEKDCWKECDSFCCRWNFKDFGFKIIPSGGTLFYMEEEYSYISRHGKVPAEVPHRMSLDYGGERPLTLLYLHCQDCDNCGKLFSRTLYCKLYPLLPVFTPDGKLKDVKNISVYDVTMNMAGGTTPCSVIGKKEFYRKLWEKEPGRLDLLREPYVLFHLRAADILNDHYSAVLKNKKSLAGLKGKDFWQRWEMEYLAGRLVDKASLTENVRKEYEFMRKIYGDFMGAPLCP